MALIIQQLYHLELCSIGPVIACGLIFGGLALYTIILWGASLYIHGAMAFTFTLLVLGFVLLDLAHFGYPAMSKIAAYVLIFGALNAWYMMAHVIFLQVFGRDVLPVGKPWFKKG